MSKGVGFYLLGRYLRKCHAWPTSHGFRGYGAIILIAITMIWGIHPLLAEIINYKTNYSKLLFHLVFFTMGTVIIFASIQLLRKTPQLFELIYLLGDFKPFGIPERISFMHKYMNTILKAIRYGGFLMGYVIVCYTMLQNDCDVDVNTKVCLIMEYYIPFNLKPWQITLIVLFQIYVIGVVINVLLLSILFYTYSLELLIVRIEQLDNMIDNIHLTRNRKRNFKILRPVVLYHQDIYWMFTCIYSFFNTFLAPTKVCILLCLTMSITEFVLKSNFISLNVITMNCMALFLVHTIGQRVTTAAGNIAEAVYNLNWFEADVSTRKDILILLCMSQKPLVLGAPLFGPYSHTAAVKEYKMAYVFYKWILTFVQKIMT